jgi:hypothetical protein
VSFALFVHIVIIMLKPLPNSWQHYFLYAFTRTRDGHYG